MAALHESKDQFGAYYYYTALTSGTRSPFSMMAVSFFPLSDPDCTSARSRSPEERWV